MNDTIEAASDAEWEASGEPPQKKRRIPKWLMFGCGCGCLVMVAAIALLAVIGFRAVDPDVQWPKIQEVLAFDEQPTGYDVIGVPVPGVEMFTLTDETDRYVVNLYRFESLEADDAEALFSERLGETPFGLGQPKGAELGSMDVQGKSVRVLRFTGMGGTSAIDPLGGGIRFDLSEDGGGMRVVEFRTMQKSAAVTDEQIEDFFGHFDVWR